MTEHTDTDDTGHTDTETEGTGGGSLAAWWGQLAALGVAVGFVAVVPGGALGAVVCGALVAEYQEANNGVSPDGIGCVVPGLASYAGTAAVLFALAVWWGSGKEYPRASLRLARSMVGVAPLAFLPPAVAFLVVGASPASSARALYLAVGAVYLGACVAGGLGAWRGGRWVGPAALAATVLAATPTLLLPAHREFGVTMATPVLAPGLGLTLAAVLLAGRWSARARSSAGLQPGRADSGR